MTETRLLLGDCVEEMRKLDAESVDAVCADPPYGIEFMGSKWDSFRDREGLDQTDEWDRPRDTPFARRETPRYAGKLLGSKVGPNVAFQEWCYEWATEALRVLKPGGFLLAFGGTRTYHRLTCAVEDAGFEIRDRFWTPGGDVAGELAWMFGSGFPKSLDVSKAIDKAAGVERTEVVGIKPGHEDFVDRTDAFAADGRSDGWERPWREDDDAIARSHQVLAAVTPEAEQWQGWGTALKPAHEPIVVARKPLVGTVAQNVLAHGTGALNIDACRVGFAGAEDERESKTKNQHEDFGSKPRDNNVLGDMSQNPPDNYDAPGRWPANVILLHLDGCVRVGAREVKGDGNWSGSTKSVGYEGGWDTSDHPRDQRVPNVEQQEVWECAEGCPVSELDAQSGDLGKSAGTAGGRAVGKSTDVYMDAWAGAYEPGERLGFGDRGGASRFFKTVAPGPEDQWECAPGCPVAELDQQSGVTKDGVASGKSRGFAKDGYVGGSGSDYDGEPIGYGSAGGASRFFYCAKVGRAERNAGLDGFAKRPLNWSSGEQSPGTFQAEGTEKAARNSHPTVKPIALMRWLIRLVCPPDGVVLDPFLGSGSTGCAAVLEDCVGTFIGIERDEDYMRIAEARIAFWREHGEDALAALREREQAESRRRDVEDAGQLDIFAP